MQHLSEFLHKKFLKAFILTFSITSTLLGATILTWGLFSTKRILKQELQSTSDQVTSYIYDKNLSNINFLLQSDRYSQLFSNIKIVSKENDQIFFESVSPSSFVPTLCERNSSSEIIRIEGCAPIISNEIIISALVSIIIYASVFTIIFKIIEIRSIQSLKLLTREILEALEDTANNFHQSPISEIQMMKEKLFEKSQALLKLNSKVVFVETTQKVVHDLRSPLAVIQNLANLKTLGQAEMLWLSKATDQLQKISTHLLNNLREGFDSYPKSSRLSLGVIIKEIIELKKQEFQNLDISFDINIHSHIQIWLNQIEFSRMVSNLINNSIDEIRKESNGIKIFIKSEETKEGLTICFSDNGPGFKDEVLKKFKSKNFITTKSKGNAVGLKSAFEFIAKNGGDLLISNNEHGGAAVTIKIPLSKTLHPDTPIIIIDDDKYVRLSWCKVGKENGFKVFAFETYLEFDKQSETLDKNSEIFIDSNLRDVKGEHVVSEIFGKGFSKVNLATGNDPQSFGHIEGLNDILNKKFPYFANPNSIS